MLYVTNAKIVVYINASGSSGFLKEFDNWLKGYRDVMIALYSKLLQLNI